MAAPQPLTGRTVDHYRVLELIGAGGRGEVYRARDERLERDVAIKVLPAGALSEESARKRFRAEALTLSRLNHPNLATIYDFGSEQGLDFLVMEYLSGVTLSVQLREGALPEKEVVRLGAQMADGLAAAHAEGIVHRDLKPGNLRLLPDGRLKILDFGLAKFFAPLREGSPTQSLTHTQGITGTLPYMAPEQLRGGKPDPRTDLWAAGCVLYEMATGKPPFTGDVAPQITDRILHEQPVPPRIVAPHCSPGLEMVVLKCLEKDADQRYQSARELAVDLRRLATSSSAVVPATAPRRRLLWVLPALLAVLLALGLAWRLTRAGKRPASAPIQSLAVLPFENLSGNPAEEFFVDGMQEELISDLAKIRALKVISRTSTMQYKEARKPLPEIARELGVDAVIEGSVRRSGNDVRITVQLIRASSDEHLWAESYQRQMHDILALQNEVAQAIARQVQVVVTPAEASRLAGGSAVNPEAHELYLRGRYFWNQKTQEGFDASIRYYEQALQKDPLYAKAYVGLADTYSELGIWGRETAGLVMPKAKAAALKALELDPSLGEPHATLCEVAETYEWDWATAERECRRALELAPGYAYAHNIFSRVLQDARHHDEALREVRLAQQLDPLSTSLAVDVAICYLSARRYDEALGELQKILALHPEDLYAKFALGEVLTQKGRYEEAIQVFLSRKVPTAATNWSLGYTYGLAGKKKEAREVLQYLLQRRKETYVPATLIAFVYIGLGERDSAFAWLEKGYLERDSWLTELQVNPMFDRLRSEKRF